LVAEARKQFVDPQVSRRKFDRELAEYTAMAETYLEKGWLMLEATFPSVLVMMVARQLPVPAIVTGVHFDYTNYDVEPPSVQLVDPLTRIPYRAASLPVRLDRQVPGPTPPALAIGPVPIQMTPVQPYMQWYGPDDIPFLCLAGVYEYHTHPAHSGDPWEIHRPEGAGRLYRILEIIHRYGVAPIDTLAVQLQFVPQIQGFHSNPPS
jgi:hypothetical protein